MLHWDFDEKKNHSVGNNKNLLKTKYNSDGFDFTKKNITNVILEK